MGSILVLLESVPDPDTLKISKLNGSITETEVRKLDERDRGVVEVASKVSDATGLTVCHPDDISSMRYPLAKGLDNVVAITGNRARIVGKLILARAIASFVKARNYTKVLGRSGLLPSLLGAILNYEIIETKGENFNDERRIFVLNSNVEIKPPSAIHIVRAAGKKVETIDFVLAEQDNVKDLLVLSREVL